MQVDVLEAKLASGTEQFKHEVQDLQATVATVNHQATVFAFGTFRQLQVFQGFWVGSSLLCPAAQTSLT